MYKIKTTNKFEKDFTKAHLLSGNYNGYWECHIKPDWLLIWRQDDKTKVIELVRTGTHSDLFS
ncbi:MAG TPA: type II toxin-antitoxin system YafQ family toxin [Prolixibacteraceae bacterium]